MVNNRIVYGNRTYNNDELISVKAFIGDALVSETLSVDTMTVVVRDYSNLPELLASEGYLVAADGMLLISHWDKTRIDETARYGEDVLYYRDNTLIGRFKLESIKRTGKNEYELHCVSAVGLLLTSQHYGGMYRGETVATVVADVIGGIVKYTLSAELASVPLYGWLPKATRRDNLRDILFAIGGQIRKDTVGEINIVPMTTPAPYRISPDNIYMGGSVTGTNPATVVNVTEHSYSQLSTDQTVTLYEGESAAYTITTPKGAKVEGVLVDFREPIYDLKIENASILESGVNYAVISGSPSVLLTGKQYTHTERIVTRTRETAGAPNTVSSSACTLVSLLNSELVAERLMAYYGSGKTVAADIVVDKNKPGDAVEFTDPFGDETSGFITEMSLTASEILKAQATIVAGFVPTASGNFYSRVMEVTRSGTVTIPADSKGRIRFVLIGGGDGGAAGEKGEDGEYGNTSENGWGGEGGIGGNGGNPGKVFVGTMAVKPLSTITAVVGAGGTGAQFGGIAGKGNPTTLGSYSSANGFVPKVGYTDILSEKKYAFVGNQGTAGGHGIFSNPENPREPTKVEYNGQIWSSGLEGQNLVSETPSLGSAGGGQGGGAAVGSNGGNGGDARRTLNSSMPDGYAYYGGRGGDGATPTLIPPKASVRGSGGMGGFGGGGGGGGGGSTNAHVPSKTYLGIPGTGGNGGRGGDGADGIILIYY